MDETQQNLHLRIYIALGILIVIAATIIFFVVRIYNGGVNEKENQSIIIQPRPLTEDERAQIAARVSSTTTFPQITSTERDIIEKQAETNPISPLTDEEKAQIEAPISK